MGVKCGSTWHKCDPIAHWPMRSNCSTGTQPPQALSLGISTQSFHGLLPDSCLQSGEATPLPVLLVSLQRLTFKPEGFTLRLQ